MENTMSDINDILTQIAKDHLFIETLESRNSGQLDFHDVGVISLKKALYAAYMMGCEAGKQDQQFQSGQKVRNQFGEVLTILRQEGCQVFIEEECNTHYHPTKLFPILKPTSAQNS
jgi:hypothetical protein